MIGQVIPLRPVPLNSWKIDLSVSKTLALG